MKPPDLSKAVKKTLAVIFVLLAIGLLCVLWSAQGETTEAKFVIREDSLGRVPPDLFAVSLPRRRLPAPPGKGVSWSAVAAPPPHYYLANPVLVGVESIILGAILHYAEVRAQEERRQAEKEWQLLTRYLGYFENGDARVCLSPDGRRVGCVAQRGEKRFVVVDGVEGKEYEGILAGTLLFSPDSKRFAYVAQRGNKRFVVMDGVEGKEYDWIGIYTLSFSPDSKRAAYLAERGGEEFIVVDGEEFAKHKPGGRALEDFLERYYQGTVPPEHYWMLPACTLPVVFSPDGNRWAYPVRRTLFKWAVVVDGVAGKKYVAIPHIVFSPDSKRLGYVVGRSSAKRRILAGNLTHDRLVVLDGVEGNKYKQIEAGGLFSPDSKRVAYAAQRGGKWLAVVDGLEGKEYDKLPLSPVFSPDRQRVAYAARKGDNWLAVVDGVEGREYTGWWLLDPPLFSPDSRRVAFAAERGSKWVAVEDGVEEEEWDLIQPASMVFSPDSKRLAYTAGSLDKWWVVVDRVGGKKYDWASRCSFSPDSKHVAYWARRGTKQLVVVDGVEAGEYDSLRSLPPVLQFDSPTSLHAVAVRSGKFFRLEIEMQQ